MTCACGGDGVAAHEPLPFELPEHFPEPLIPADNHPTVARIELGRYLFYDTRLSRNQNISCASCHRQEHAFADNEATSIGTAGKSGALNAPSLANVLYMNPLTWAHAETTIIEDQLLLPMFGDEPEEMGMTGWETVIVERLVNDPEHSSMFASAYPERSVDVDTMRLALACFVRSLVSGTSPFDDFIAGNRQAVSAAAGRGADLFYSPRLGCGSCHSGYALTTAVVSQASATRQSAYHNIGLYNIDGQGAYPDAARGLVDDSGMASDMGRFRVPSLRNVAVTAPYMHDGSVETLEDVVRVYERGGRVVANGANAGDGATSPLRSGLLADFELSDGERGDLLAFLDTLTDRQFLGDSRHSNPW